MIFDHKFNGNFDFDRLSSISELLIILHIRYLLFVWQSIKIPESWENFKKILVNTAQNFNKILISRNYVKLSN